MEKVIHTAVRPASEPCDEERHLLYQADAVDTVGEAGCSSLASSDHVTNSANSDVPQHRSLHELQENTMSTANTHHMLSNEERDAEACGEPHGSEGSARSHTRTSLHALTSGRPEAPW